MLFEDFEKKNHITSQTITDPDNVCQVNATSYINKFIIECDNVMRALHNIFIEVDKPKIIQIQASALSRDVYTYVYLRNFFIVKSSRKDVITFCILDRFYYELIEVDTSYDHLLDVTSVDKILRTTKIGSYVITYIKNDIYISQEHYAKGKMWEPWMMDIIQVFYTSGDVIDVGAHIGSFALYAAKVVKNDKIHCFEPIYDDVLKINIDQNNIKNAIIYNVGLGSSEKEIIVKPYDYSLPQNFGGFTLTTDGNDKTIKIMKMDDYSFKDVCIIKIDVEGMEIDVMEGGKNTIKDDTVIIFENLHGDDDVYQTETMKYFLKNDYTCFRVADVDWIAIKNSVIKKLGGYRGKTFYVFRNILLYTNDDKSKIGNEIIHVNDMAVVVEPRHSVYTWFFKI